MIRRNHLIATALSATLAAPGAFATNGMFSHGYGTASKGLAGATTALPQTSLAAATNPAGSVKVGDRMDMGVAFFTPRREYDSSAAIGPGLLIPEGTRESGKNWFAIPSFGYNRMLSDDRSIGLSLYGNGGMNTDYPSEIRPIVPFSLLACRGAFCNGRANINYEQLFINLNYAQEISDNVSVGVSPIAAVQRFRAKGLRVFSLFTSDFWGSGPRTGTNISDQDYEWSYGGGLKVGMYADLSPTLSLGAAYQTKMYMTELDDYDDLFAENGDLDIPATANIGLAFKPNSEHTFTFDVQHIFYSDVEAIGNPGTSRLLSCGLVNIARPFDDNACLLGGSNGAGFGWEDMTVFKAGWQWQMDPRTTTRLGFSYGEQPIGSSEILFNILAPAMIEKHVTAGLTRKMGENNELSLAVTYAMETEHTGGNPFSLGFEDITLRMYQWDIDVGWSWVW